MKGSTFPAKKALARRAGSGHDRIVRAIDLLAEADLDLRGGKAWPDELVIEVLVARLATCPADRPVERLDAAAGPARAVRAQLAAAAALSFLARPADLRRAAAFLWITPLAAALSMRFRASAGRLVGVLGAVLGGRRRRVLVRVFSSERTALLRSGRFSFCRLRLIWLLMLATGVLPVGSNSNRETLPAGRAFASHLRSDR